MIKQVDIRVSPEVAGKDDLLKQYVSSRFGIPLQDISFLKIDRRSIDARGKKVIINLRVLVFGKDEFIPKKIQVPDVKNVKNAKEIIIVGSGPAGLFAAIRVLRGGLKPIILERGKDVKERIKDIKNLNVRHIVNEDSNYCFGEGGAGTYSDGKLYTRSTKRGNIAEVLNLLVAFGATEEILVDAHPHIGTNKLPGIIKNIREFIIEHGGEVHFNTRVTDFLVSNDKIEGVVCQGGLNFKSDKVILATGHSARDIFELLKRKNIKIECKPLAIGVRVEHPQKLIDTIQYNCEDRGPYLPPSPYSIAKQVNGRGVYSFCMCPGGVIAPCATSPGEIVTNGWSSSRRARSTANSGIVVELRMDDFKPFEKHEELAAVWFQKSIETKAWNAAGRTQKAPAQLLVDFVDNKRSNSLPKTSYAPGIESVNLSEIIPDYIYETLKNGFKKFDQSMRGYLTNEAVVHAPETRTSSPVRIPRDNITLQHVEIEGLYPCGEGAGYAGGIISAALDGQRCADAILRVDTQA